jgi:hypothetical protein
MSIENVIIINWTTLILYYNLITIPSKHVEEIMLLHRAGMQQQLFNSKTNHEGKGRWKVPTDMAATFAPLPTQISNSSFANLLVRFSPCNDLRVWIIYLVSNTHESLEDTTILIFITFIPKAEISLPFFFFCSSKYFLQLLNQCLFLWQWKHFSSREGSGLPFVLGLELEGSSETFFLPLLLEGVQRFHFFFYF